MSENKKRIIIIAAVAAVCVGLYFGGQAVVDHAQAAQQAELDAYQAEQQAQLEAARKAEEEAAAKASTITLAPIPSNNATAAARRRPSLYPRLRSPQSRTAALLSSPTLKLRRRQPPSCKSRVRK